MFPHTCFHVYLALIKAWELYMQCPVSQPRISLKNHKLTVILTCLHNSTFDYHHLQWIWGCLRYPPNLWWLNPFFSCLNSYILVSNLSPLRWLSDLFFRSSCKKPLWCHDVRPTSTVRYNMLFSGPQVLQNWNLEKWKRYLYCVIINLESSRPVQYMCVWCCGT